MKMIARSILLFLCISFFQGFDWSTWNKKLKPIY